MRFGPWNIEDDIKTEVEFAKRISSALAIKPSQIIREDRESAIINGSGAEPYQVTLSSCTCADFALKGNENHPCKHMIRLAIDSGKYPTFISYKPTVGAKEKCVQIIQGLRDAWISGAISSEAFQKAAGALMKDLK